MQMNLTFVTNEDSSLTTNQKPRKVTENGREYLVVPLTSIVPGVLNGSQGPLFYPPEETSKDVGQWNSVPLVVYHPTDSLGRPVSAKHPGVIKSSGIGVARETTYNGKLQHEGWFDLAKTKLVDKRVYNALIKGQKLELSTGLYTRNEPAPDGSVYNGRPYTHMLS